jgi:hypothetical protein
MLSDCKFSVCEIKGLKSVRPFQVTSVLSLGLLMLPVNMNKLFDVWHEDLVNLPPEDQRKMVEQAVRFVELKEEEIAAMVSFCKDANGVPIDKSNVGNFKPNELLDMIVAVCLEVLKIDVFFCQKTDLIKSPTIA